MAKGKHVKKEKGKKKKGDEDKKTKDLNLKENEEEENKLNETDLKLISLQALQRQEAERQETLGTIKEIGNLVLQLRQEKWDAKLWNRYISCDGRPSLDDIPELNSFISKWLNENSNETPDVIMHQCDVAFELLQEVQQMKFEVDAFDFKNSNYEKLQMRLKSAIDSKLNEATFNSLLDMRLTINPDTGNSFCDFENNNVVIAIWANLVCNPRYNASSSSKIDVSFTIPRDIINSECGVRMMRTDFDHFSPLSSYYRSFEMGNFAKDRKGGVASNRFKKGNEEVLENWDENSIDLREYFSIGPILSLQLVAVPSQPRKVQNWIMTKVEDEQSLKLLPWNCSYVSVGIQNDADDSRKDEEELEMERQRAINEMAKLVSIAWKLPCDILYSDIPKLARWDTENNQWTQLGLYEVNYKEESTSILFYTSYFGFFTILLPKFVSFPYQSWELTPIIESEFSLKTKFAITTMTGSAEILIEAENCRLLQLQSNDKLYLESLYGKEMQLYALIKKLQEVGFIITPNRNDNILTNSIKHKSWSLEDMTYKHMALACAEFQTGFMYSRWNSSVGVDKIVVGLHDTSTSIPKTVVLITESNSMVLMITDLSQNYNEIPADNQATAVDLYHLVQLRRQHLMRSLSPDEFSKREMSLFINTIYQMLAVTRVFCS